MNKVIGESKYDFSMLYINGKLTFGSLVRATFKDSDGSEDSGGGFFSKAASTDESVKVFTSFMYVKPDGKSVDMIDVSHKGAQFLVSGKGAPTFDKYSEEIAKAIKKDVGKYKGFLKKQPEGTVINFGDLETAEQAILIESDKFKDSGEMAIKQYTLMMKGIEAERKKHAGLGLDDFLARYSFKKHILLTGPAGHSKTYSATKWIDESGYESEFIAGSSAIEAIDLLGYWVKDSTGNLVWLDGVLTAAFRKALKGKTVLLFDELLRVPARELSILVGALTPDSSGHYRLRTNRLVDEVGGVGEVELLTVPMENLHVIATTNIGADYDVDNIDVALQDRFRTHDVVMATSTIFSICEEVNDGKLPDATISSLLDLYEKVKLLVDSSELTRAMSLRHLTEVINYADDPSDVASFCQDLATIICARDTSGTLNETERRIFISTIKKTIR